MRTKLCSRTAAFAAALLVNGLILIGITAIFASSAGMHALIA